MESINQQRFVLESTDFPALLQVLNQDGYEVVGPTISAGAITYDTISDVADLPIGWTDEQERGFYRLQKQSGEAFFNYTVGPQSWKKYLLPPRQRLWQAQRQNGDFGFNAESIEEKRYAFLGVRACELQAILIQDRIFLQGQPVDPAYQQHRQNVFIVAVNCSRAGETCFCASMGTGPAAEAGFDLALTEVLDDDHHYFVVEIGSEQGASVLNQLPQRAATDAETIRAQQIIDNTANNMGRQLDASQVREVVYASTESASWDKVASRCLACGNCTLVCPTCFCTTIEDSTDLTGETAERHRIWDSCFTMDFSYIHGGSVRYSSRARYRQWLTHKMATWVDQFGMLGCVGCGRCITWCPVGIDITAEVQALQATAAVPQEKGNN
jgi:sulfhydrogenase subunit beta (sulfur reductase)